MSGASGAREHSHRSQNSASRSKKPVSEGIPKLNIQQQPQLADLIQSQHARYLRLTAQTPVRHGSTTGSAAAVHNRGLAVARWGQWPEGLNGISPQDTEQTRDVPMVDDGEDLLDFDSQYFLSQDLSQSTGTMQETSQSVNALESYTEAVFHHRSICCVRITTGVWVIEGWKEDLPEVGSFYHVAALELPSALSASCDCSSNRLRGSCIHVQLLKAQWISFKGMHSLSPGGSPHVIEIAQQLYGRTYWLSVIAQDEEQAPAVPGMHKRCVVSAITSEQWECHGASCRRGKLPFTSCLHRKRAHHYVHDYHGSQAFGDSDNMIEDEMTMLQQDPSILLQRQPVSFLPIAPPAFARFSSEPASPPALHAHQLPSIIPLGASFRCYVCGNANVLPTGSCEVRSVRIYLVLGMQQRSMEVGRCSCRSSGEKRTIGPDLGDLGLFNFNNEIVLSHAVLNSYSSQMLRSSTPLTAFQSTITDLYLEHGYDGPFLSKSTFVRAFFLFVSLQPLPSSFSCSLCGPHPDIVVADGVVLAHTLKETSNLCPPTEPGASLNSLPRPGLIKPFLPVRSVRVALRSLAEQLGRPAASIAVLLAGSSCLQQLQSAANTSHVPSSLTLLNRIQTLLRHPAHHPLLERANIYCAALLRQISAEEGQLQMCRPLCLSSLAVVSDDTVDVTSETYALHAGRLSITCPAIGNLACYLKQDMHLSSASVAAVRAVWAAVYQSVRDYLGSLPVRDTPLPDTSLVQPLASAGVLYGCSKVRERPQYPQLKESKKGSHLESVVASETSTCNKFYADYVKPRRTGGIMAIWCRHAIAVGFHCIPAAEGRDDVFSALFTHWPQAPRVVVYDFACQLASYCLAREPAFFADTLFVVDELHQHGHSQCTPSSWLSTYMANDPDLRHLNSSAAECGNAGLSRIKKSVAYATAPHAIALTRHFLALWNRRKIKDLQRGNDDVQ